MASFKIEFKNLDKNIRDIKKTVENLLSQAEILNFASIAAKDIYRRTKEGIGVAYDIESNNDNPPTEEKLEKLSPNYIKRRKSKGVKGEFGTPEKSNLTNTGQMLKAIKAIKNRGGASIVITDSSRDDTSLSNRDVAGYASIIRPFFNISNRQAANLNKQIERVIRQKLRRLNGR